MFVLQLVPYSWSTASRLCLEKKVKSPLEGLEEMGQKSGNLMEMCGMARPDNGRWSMEIRKQSNEEGED